MSTADTRVTLRETEYAPQLSRPAESAWAEIPPAIRERLAGYGLHSTADWRRLGTRRHRLFGVVPSVVAQLDVLARRRP